MPRPVPRPAASRLVVSDGAMGTLLQSYGMREEDYRGDRFPAHPRPLAGNGDVLVLTQPEIVRAAHEAYLEAGAEMIGTNTFGATSLVQADYGLDAAAGEMNAAAARLARAAADAWSLRTPDRPRIVAGVIGPTNRAISLRSSTGAAGLRPVEADALRDACRRQALTLLQSGVDLLRVETLFDVPTAIAIVGAILDAFEAHGAGLPLVVMATLTREGRLRSGEPAGVLYRAIRHARPMAFGVNCSFGVRGMRPWLSALADIVDCGLACSPSAGLPGDGGMYPDSPDIVAEGLRALVDDGLAQLVGGCCGTTPAYIRALCERTAASSGSPGA